MRYPFPGGALLLAFLAATTLGVTGCVQLRMIEARQQLKEPARYFTVHDQEELSLEFLQPVLMAADIAVLLGDSPARSPASIGRFTWEYRLQKLHTDDNAETSIPFRLVFRDSRLKRLSLPVRFTQVLSKEKIMKILPSLRFGEVKRDTQGLSYRWQNGGVITLDPGARDRMLQVLGEPFMTTEAEDGETLAYSYWLARSDDEGPQQRSRILLMWLTFSDDGTLQQLKMAFRGFAASFRFANPKGNA